MNGIEKYSLKGRSFEEFEKDMERFNNIEEEIMEELKRKQKIKEFTKVGGENKLNPKNKEIYDFKIKNNYGKEIKIEVKTIGGRFEKLEYFNITKYLGNKIKEENIFLILLNRKNGDLYLFSPNVKKEICKWKGLGKEYYEGYKIYVKERVKFLKNFLN